MEKFYLELYPEDLEIIMESLEQFKFSLDKSLYFTDNQKNLKKKV